MVKNSKSDSAKVTQLHHPCFTRRASSVSLGPTACPAYILHLCHDKWLPECTKISADQWQDSGMCQHSTILCPLPGRAPVLASCLGMGSVPLGACCCGCGM